MTDYLELGTKVAFSADDVLVRGCVDEPGRDPLFPSAPPAVPGARLVRHYWVDRWLRYSEHVSPGFSWKPVPDRGVIVGVRTIADGHTDFDRQFHPIAHHRVYLVAHSLYLKPIYLHLDDVRSLP